MTVHAHRPTAVAVDETSDRRQTVTMEDGRLSAGMDAVVLALGHGELMADQEARALADFARRHGLA